MTISTMQRYEHYTLGWEIVNQEAYHSPQAVLYTDTYFEMGDQSFQISNSRIPKKWHHNQATLHQWLGFRG